MFSIRRAKNTFRRVLVPFFRGFKLNKEKNVFLPNVRKVMVTLREKSRQVRQNNKRIDEWVDQFINRCALNGQPVTILTQWCISRDLEVRYRKQNGFIPTKAEEKLFRKELQDIAGLFRRNGISLNWIITFNRSYLDSGRIEKSIEDAYKQMIMNLAKPLVEEGWLILLDWEDDVLEARSKPDIEVIARIYDFVSEGALRIEIERHSAWAREEAGLTQSSEELQQDVFFQIACEVKEGQLLSEKDSLMGECILVPLEVPERYDFFFLKALSLKERIAPILQTYLWRA